MSLNEAIFAGVKPAAAPVSDAAVIVFKHALKVWAREQGVAERDLPGLTDLVLEFAGSAIRDARR